MSKKESKSDDALDKVRKDIDSLDKKLLELLSERREKSRAAVELKYSGQAPLRDRAREESLLSKLISEAKAKNLDSHLVTKIFHEILEDSIRYQQHFLQARLNGEGNTAEFRKAAFQGSRGSFSYLAAEQFFSRLEVPVAFNGCQSYQEVIELVEKGQVDYAVVPIENTVSGGINEVYDLLQKTRLSIVGEERYKITPCLLGLAESELSKVNKIYAHPQLVIQCSHYLTGLSASIQSCFNPLNAFEEMRHRSETNSAIVASEQAAEVLGLKILKREIANYKENYTRFLIIARKPLSVDPRVASKTSLVMATTQKPGALVEALLVFRDNNISLTKLESRPILGNPSEEMFYVDFEGNIEDPEIQNVIEGLRRHTKFLKILGSYPSSEISRTSCLPQSVAREHQTVDERDTLVSSQSSKLDAMSPSMSPSMSPATSPSTPASTTARKKRSAGYRLGSRAYKEQDTIIELKGVTIGGDSFVVVGGPCSVESSDQVMQCAQHLRETGGHILRGGCFKPRTSPYSFQGLGYEGLDILVKAGAAYDFPVITEVLAVEDVQRVAASSDMLQIGARNMQNFSLLQEVGRTQRPVMLKRGMSSSIDDLLHAAEYILSQGNLQVILCERGIRTFETATRNTLDLSAVPVLRRESHLPVIVDPSHAAGERDLIAPLVYAARAVGAHGVMVEFHPNPEEALSDGPQALRFHQFDEMMQKLALLTG